jgi:hypothetical protein
MANSLTAIRAMGSGSSDIEKRVGEVELQWARGRLITIADQVMLIDEQGAQPARSERQEGLEGGSSGGLNSRTSTVANTPSENAHSLRCRLCPT